MTNDYTTFLCLVLGQHPRHAFQVNCSRDASIADLRDQVQEKGGLEHVLAKDITLYYAELPCQDLDAIAKFQPANKYLLYPGLRIKSTPLTAREEYITVIAVLDSKDLQLSPRLPCA